MYNVIEKHTADLKALQGPLYHLPEIKHGFEDDYRTAPPEIKPDLVGKYLESDPTKITLAYWITEDSRKSKMPHIHMYVQIFGFDYKNP